MSEATASRRVLHLVVEGFPPERLEALAASSSGTNDVTQIFKLTEASATEALEKIFAAETIAVWGKI
jgi:hypothetical protein